MGKFKLFIKRLLMPLVAGYFRLRTFYPVWFYLLNNKNRRLYQKNPPKLDSIQTRVLRDLNATGIAVLDFHELFPKTEFPNFLERLKQYAHALKNQPAKTPKDKPFLRYLLPAVQTELRSPVLEFSFSEKILSIVNSYLKMWSRFYYLTLNLTLPVSESSNAIGSQRWHRDPEDKKLCKVFVYLTDVDENSGPFIYIPGSTYGLRLGRLFPQKPPFGFYPKERMVEKIVKREDIKILTGKAGTVIFADTAGLHKGGLAWSKERIMLTVGYRSDASIMRPRVAFSEDLSRQFKSEGDDVQNYAREPAEPSKFAKNLSGQYQRWGKELGQALYAEG